MSNNFEERQLQSMAAFGSDREVREDEATSVFAAILVVLEMIETGRRGASSVSNLAIFE